MSGEGGGSKISTEFKKPRLALRLATEEIDLKLDLLHQQWTVESVLELLKLDIDCLEELFEWLSQADLLLLRKTCKRLKGSVDHYIKSNWPKFGEFQIYDARSFDMFRRMDITTIKLIKNLVVVVRKNDQYQFEDIKTALNNVERIAIFKWEISCDFYEVFLKHCKNLKCLTVDVSGEDILIGSSNDWLLREYQTLEHIIFNGRNLMRSPSEIEKLKTFFRLNTNVQSIWETFDDAPFLTDIDITFDQLRIRFYMKQICSDGEDYLVKLARVHQKGLYKRLHIFIDDCSNERWASNYGDGLVNVGLEQLASYGCMDFPHPLPYFKELTVLHCENPKYLEKVRNIEWLYIVECGPNAIASFTSYLPKLKHFRIGGFDDADEETILNLLALNKERAKLAGACKTTIYVPEKIFLATKWAKTKTDFNLIELKRHQASPGITD
ncbi:uncharacterized protein LOC129571329, partial [Sitodiplosis mosellana]|uniref:uncharacterized protein LOC129571329 n=1 Tax=Sitodiplosis mosellana TaxID=263140 RepID=UPI0024449492